MVTLAKVLANMTGGAKNIIPSLRSILCPFGDSVKNSMLSMGFSVEQYRYMRRNWADFALISALAILKAEVLLLAHIPLFGAVYADWGADYTFSGHIHGGVVRLFGVGILSPERKFFPKYSKGIYDISGKKLLVSAGVGKLRMFNPPEIITYKL